MHKILVGLSVGLLAAPSIAQIPMSKYVRTFSASATRGYFFQAPVDFEVTQLQVPDETNRGEYMVALYRLTAAPPPFSQTVAATPDFYAGSVKSHECAVLPTPVAFKTGEWVAVLGAAGPESGGSVGNSYGASGGANNPSAILGTPIAIGLQRCGMQINIGPTKGVGAMFSEVRGPISRIKLTVQAPGGSGDKGANSCDFCPPSNGTASLDICGTNPAIAGATLILEMKSGGAANTGGLLAFGFLRGDIPVPGFGRLCILGISGLLPFGSGPIASGPVTGTQVNVPIPATGALGASIVFQGALATSGPTIPLTNGLEVVVGK